jgi:GNAT superfamily N-acetyltransferase
MIVQIKNNKQILLRNVTKADFDNLFTYLQLLSDITKNRFGPHKFDKQTIADLFSNNNHRGFIAFDMSSNRIVAYAIIKLGYLEHDADRLQSYGLQLNHETDCTFAPSVADDWQSSGLGNQLFQFILSELKSKTKVNRMILWGGVQTTNQKAVNYYLRNGFKILGTFHYNVDNYDMVLDI